MAYILNATYRIKSFAGNDKDTTLENAIRWSSMNSIKGLRLVNTDR